VVIEPSASPRPEASERLVHYPFARVRLESAGTAASLWLDASRGRVLDPGSPRPGARDGASGRIAAVILASFGTFFAAGLLLPFPWCLGAGALASPFLLRWGGRALETER
jgi:hypothetical protein